MGLSSNLFRWSSEQTVVGIDDELWWFGLGVTAFLCILGTLHVMYLREKRAMTSAAETAKMAIRKAQDARVARELETKLKTAARSGDVEALAAAIEHHDVDWADSSGRTLLYTAAVNGHTAAAAKLVALGAAIDKAPATGITPLLAAITNIRPGGPPGCRETAIQLLKLGADATAPDSTGEAPVLAAARLADSELIKRLCECGANIEHKNDAGVGVMQIASDGGDAEEWRVFRKFINKGRRTVEITGGGHTHKLSARAVLRPDLEQQAQIAAERGTVLGTAKAIKRAVFGSGDPAGVVEPPTTRRLPTGIGHGVGLGGNFGGGRAA